VPEPPVPSPDTPITESSVTPGERTRPTRRRATPWKDDQEIVGKILAGSREHFDMLYDTYFPCVYRFALRMMQDTAEAEDVTQEVFVTVFRVLHTFQGKSSLLVWIFGITRNKVNRHFRRKRARLESIGCDALELPSGEPPPDASAEARRLLVACETVVEDQLPPLQRHIFHLRYVRLQSIRTIASALGRSEDAVKTNLTRMRRSLMTRLPALNHLLEV